MAAVENYAFERDDASDNPPEDTKMEESKTKSADKSTTSIGINLNFDMGTLLLEDCQSYADISGKEFSKRTAANICAVYKQLFDLKKKQDAEHGPEGEILEHDRAQWAVDMPASGIVLPREKPIPIEKPKTKWEKFREEKGL